ncbi:isoleucyl-tRNA synthetase [Pedobacter sp. HMWF019]|uniref:isoleucyl-tRNA synthetase n=1 Tax=Pedobacter sp. HMWF019 TaxID=2056856 RepID=UPI000D39A789|nr:isoleucyl-tRNA synthetase [Pedobacter sp. HMWF019]PTS92876.1 isoleucyl-tRNA synthetase [Pedobacter sp. HMWF019]
MVKVLKLQKAVIVIVLGLLLLIPYKVMSINKMDSSIYFLEASGALLIIGALMFLYPILFGKKDKEGNIELDPEQEIVEEADGTN